ncbi:MAG: PKD domain-containing protein [Ferruginibacter sp.]
MRNNISGGDISVYGYMCNSCAIQFDSLIIENSIIDGANFNNWGNQISGANTIIVRNNLFINYDVQNENTLFFNNFYHTNFHDAVLYNNIFYDCNPTGCVNCTFMNNLTYGNGSGNPQPFGAPFGTGSNDTLPGPANNNIYSKDPLFVNYAPLQPFSYNLDFHLAAGSPCIGAGLNGTDIGIYGGPYSFNVSEGPRIPIVDLVSISKTANPKAKNFYLQFDTRTRKSKDQTDKSRFLSQAEYWIDSLPIPGTGNFININPVDTFHYFNLIPFLIDSNCHSVAIRVKDNFGFWSFIKYGINSPKADFDYYLNGRSVVFANTSTDQQSCLWNFGDGHTSNQSSLVHEYDSAGIFNVCLVSKNACLVASDTLCKTVVLKGISTITPSHGGNNGYARMTITGFYLSNSTTVRLRKEGESDIFPIITLPINETEIISVFSLYGASPGLWDVVVQVPGDSTYTKSKSFRIEPPAECYAEPPIVNLIGPTRVRPNTSNNYQIIVENYGCQDLMLVPVWVAIPVETNLRVTFNFGMSNPPKLGNVNWNDLTEYYLDDNLFGLNEKFRVYGFTVPSIAAHSFVTYNLSLSAEAMTGNHVVIWNSPPWTTTDANNPNCLVNQEKMQCLMCIAGSKLPGCFGSIISTFAPLFINQYCYGNPNGDVMSNIRGAISIAINCGFIPESAFLDILTILADADSYGDCAQTCYNAFFPKSPLGININTIFSLDPNVKYGSTGAKNSPYVKSISSCNYTVHFENVDTATASAQTILITDSIGKDNLDLSTLQLIQIGFGDTIVAIPAGRKSFTRDIDLRPKMPLIARVTAYLNDSTGVVTSSIVSLDPVTKLPTDNVLLGVLPPNDSNGRGEGFISYSIKTKENISTGTVIKNKADIYFDNNDPITTQIWTNIIDDLKPQSKVSPLLAFTGSDTINVKWTGSDNGPANIYAYNVYSRTGNSEWKLWKYNTSLTNDVFVGELDSTYGFYSVAIDSALNAEDASLTADATTTVARPMEDSACNGANLSFSSGIPSGVTSYQWQLDTGTGYTNIVNSSTYNGAKSDTLKITSVITSFYGYKYRCIVNKGGILNTSITHVLHFINRWTGTAGSAWENIANWSCNSLPDGNTDVIVDGKTGNTPVVSSNAKCRSLSLNQGVPFKVNPNFSLIITH